MENLMRFRSDSFSRRAFLAKTAIGSAACWSAENIRLPAQESTPEIAFFVVGDTHYLANLNQPGEMDATSAIVCGRLVDRLNELPGATIPPAARGGVVVAKPAGLIHAGDIIDTGDKQGGVTRTMQETEWAAFRADYGLTGSDGRLKYPVYEVFGNHDAPHGAGLAIDRIIERNKTRPGIRQTSANGLHYSWDWGRAHFVNLGLIVGTAKTVTRKRRYAALDSLDFLVEDLKQNVANSGRPVIITHHIDIARNSGRCAPDAPTDNREWDPCDVRGFYEALRNYRIAGIFYGHTHERNVFQWDGLSPQARSGITVFNTDNGSHFKQDSQAVFYVELHPRQLVVREYQTNDRWKTGTFTPQVWTSPLES